MSRSRAQLVISIALDGRPISRHCCEHVISEQELYSYRTLAGKDSWTGHLGDRPTTAKPLSEGLVSTTPFLALLSPEG